MAYPPETRDQLRRAYVFDGLSLDLAAAKLGIAYGTAQRWKSDAEKNGDNWEKQKNARLLAGGSIEELARGMLTGLILQYQKTMEDLTLGAGELSPADRVKLLSSLSDAFNKAVASSKKVLPETSRLAVALEVIQLLTVFIKERYPQHLQAFADILEPFGGELEQKFNE
ncbi:DUF1804 family protein [Salmonella enterica]|nr:DUF1804 family protein [Salmonella enterica]